MVSLPAPDFPGYWTVFNDGIYFLDCDSGPQATINFFDFASRKTTQILTMSGAPDPWRGGLTVSPDRRRILFSQRQYSSSEIVLADGFHETVGVAQFPLCGCSRFCGGEFLGFQESSTARNQTIGTWPSLLLCARARQWAIPCRRTRFTDRP